MCNDKSTAILGGWEGYRIGAVGRFEAGDKGPTAQVWIELLPDYDRPMVCSGCGRASTAIHEEQERWVRDLPIFEAQTHLLVYRRRVLCPRCGPTVQVLDQSPIPRPRRLDIVAGDR